MSISRALGQAADVLDVEYLKQMGGEECEGQQRYNPFGGAGVFHAGLGDNGGECSQYPITRDASATVDRASDAAAHGATIRRELNTSRPRRRTPSVKSPLSSAKS